jgi:hypothetical protein
LRVDGGRVTAGLDDFLADEAGRFFLQDDERWSFWHG